MSSLTELARGQESVVDPDRDSGMGTETGMRGGDWQHGGGGDGRGPRDKVGMGGDQVTGGGLGGVTVKMGVTTS